MSQKHINYIKWWICLPSHTFQQPNSLMPTRSCYKFCWWKKTNLLWGWQKAAISVSVKHSPASAIIPMTCPGWTANPLITSASHCPCLIYNAYLSLHEIQKVPCRLLVQMVSEKIKSIGLCRDKSLRRPLSHVCQ